MRFSHRYNILKYCIFIIKTIFISFFLNNLAYSEGTKIGSITELTGEVIAITEEGEERVLDVFDEIFLKDEVLIGESSSATLQFNTSGRKKTTKPCTNSNQCKKDRNFTYIFNTTRYNICYDNCMENKNTTNLLDRYSTYIY